MKATCRESALSPCSFLSSVFGPYLLAPSLMEFIFSKGGQLLGKLISRVTSGRVVGNEK